MGTAGIGKLNYNGIVIRSLLVTGTLITFWIMYEICRDLASPLDGIDDNH